MNFGSPMPGAAASVPSVEVDTNHTVTITHRKDLVSAVMTTRAESRISHGLLVVRSWLTDPSADVALVSYCSCYHMYRR
jgi:hypothetical protein